MGDLPDEMKIPKMYGHLSKVFFIYLDLLYKIRNFATSEVTDAWSNYLPEVIVRRTLTDNDDDVAWSVTRASDRAYRECRSAFLFADGKNHHAPSRQETP